MFLLWRFIGFTFFLSFFDWYPPRICLPFKKMCNKCSQKHVITLISVCRFFFSRIYSRTKLNLFLSLFANLFQMKFFQKIWSLFLHEFRPLNFFHIFILFKFSSFQFLQAFRRMNPRPIVSLARMLCYISLVSLHIIFFGNSDLNGLV